MDLAEAIYSVVQARRNRSRVSDLVQTAVDTYHMLFRKYDFKPTVAHKIVDWYLA